jgi:hypothetical protein
MLPHDWKVVGFWELNSSSTLTRSAANLVNFDQSLKIGVFTNDEAAARDWTLERAF